MKFYDYRCPDGHVTEHTTRDTEARPETIACACGAVAVKMLSAPALITPISKVPNVPLRALREIGATAQDIRVDDYACDCGKTWWDVVEGEPPVPPCPACGGVARRVPGFPGGEWSTRMFGVQGGYYDRGLGMHIRSASHRAQVCKDRGLIPVDGDFDMDAVTRDAERKDAEHHAVYTDMVDRMEHHPGFASWRRARDQGAPTHSQSVTDDVSGLPDAVLDPVTLR